jgi:hypothetical protein
MALTNPMGFHKGKPLAALVVFRACLQWRAFQADCTSVFDHIYQVGRHGTANTLAAAMPGRLSHSECHL